MVWAIASDLSGVTAWMNKACMGCIDRIPRTMRRSIPVAVDDNLTRQILHRLVYSLPEDDQIVAGFVVVRNPGYY